MAAVLVAVALPAVAAAPVAPARSSCTIVGTPGPDVLTGTPGRDVICGRGGDDRITGGAGDDVISGGPGHDVIDGGPGADMLWGSGGDDLLRGGGGADRLNGGEGADQLRGGTGADTLRGGPGSDRLEGGRGDDDLRGGPGKDRLDGGSDEDDLPPQPPDPPKQPGDPVAVSDTFATDEDAALELPLSGAGSPAANDTDPDGDPLSVIAASGAVGGTVQLVGTTIRFVPDADRCGTAHFDYTVADGTGRTAVGRVTVDIACLPDDPTAADDVTTVGEDAAATPVDVLANDADVDGDQLTIASVTQPGDGAVVITGGGTGLTYQPDADFCTTPPGTDPDTFTYTLAPGGATATVSVHVTCVDDAPVAVADSASVGEDASATAVDVLANDTDVDGGARSIVSVTQPGHGTVAITGGGTGLTYRPTADYCNTGPGGTADTFTYTISGGSSASVAMIVTCVDDLPIAADDDETVLEDSAATPLPVLGNDTDADGDAFTIGSVTQPTDGAVVITGGGTGLTYTPSANYCNSDPGGAADTFTYSLAPGGDSATVAVTVTCVADAATAVADTATVSEDSPATAVPVLANDLNPDGLDLSITAVTEPSHGAVVITGGGTGLTYAPTADYCNSQPGGTTDTFTYTISGGTTATVAMTVTCVVDPSTAVGDVVTITEDQGGPLTVMANDVIGDDSPQIVSITQSVNGSTTTNGSTVDYTPHANYCNTGPGGTADTFTYTITGGSTATVSVTVTCVNDAPTVAPLTLSAAEAAVGNTVLVVDDPTDGVPSASGPRKTTTADLLSGAGDAETPGTVAVVAATVSTAQGGSVTLQADGDFVYAPPAGCITSDSFTYQVSDNDPAGAATGTGTVTIPVSGCVWYVANDGAGDSGTSTAPFDTLAQAQAASGADQTIYVAAGDGTSTGYASGITLKADQRLLGEVEDLVVGGVTLSAGVAGQRPQLTASSADVVTLAAGNTVAGLALDPSGTGSGIAGAAGDVGGVLKNLRVVDTGTAGTKAAVSLVSTTGAFSLQDVVIDNTATSGSGGAAGLLLQGTGAVTVQTTDVRTKGGPAVDVTNAAGSTLSFGEVTSTGSTTKGVNLDGLGTGTFSATSGSVSGAQVMAFDVNAGSGAITYPGPITDGTGGTLEVTGRTGGTITLSGSLTDSADAGGGVALSGNTGGSTVLSGATKTFNTGAGTAVSMTSSDGHTLSITGGSLGVVTTSGEGIRATSSGTLVVTGNGNTIASGTGRALWVSDTDIGAGGLVFARVDSSGGVGGILVANTGSSGSLTVTGTGTGTCTNAITSGCTGGTISGSTGADSSSTTPDGAGVVLANTKAPSLTRMWIHDHSNYAVRGAGLVGLTIANSVVNGSNGTNDATPYDDSSILLDSVSGAVSVTDSHVSGGFEDNLRITGTSAALDVTVTDVTFGVDGSRPANDALSIESTVTAAALRATITGNTFSSAAGDLLAVYHAGSGAGDLHVTGNTFANTHPAIATGGGGVTLYQSSTAGGTTMDVSGNSFRGAVGPAVLVAKGQGAARQKGTFANNTIGVAGIANSGSAEGSGLKLQQVGGGSTEWAVTDNQIRGYNNFGIEVLAGGGASPQGGIVSTVVTGNTIAEPGNTTGTLSFAKQGVHYNVGTVPGDTFDVCADIRTNTLAGSGADAVPSIPFDYDVRLRQRQSTTIRVPGYSGANNNDAAVQAHVAALNPGSPTVITSNNVIGGGGGFVGTACPVLPAP